MDLTLRITAGDPVGELSSLNDWLAADDRFAVRVLRGTGAPGTLAAGLPEALAVALAPGGVATAIATVLVTWIRHRTGAVKITGTRPDGTTFALEATHVKDLDAAGVRELTEKIVRAPALPDVRSE
ncbi:MULTISPECIES: effector-associated constant component EACC1 [unclassified Amycolatopsis]|uniref:effector-associated constant component EACC1 n=1 Tax=unclassified Amycolatopsis TaxID=2618356 RepID=UPI002E24D1B4|nr:MULTISPECIES: hypothetical protein [unclassified Amycolatopsis]